MTHSRLPFRDPRTIARDIPGVLDVLFPRLTGGLVTSLNRAMFAFAGIYAIPNELIEQSKLQKAMLFEISMARAEFVLSGVEDPRWDDCLEVASARQRRHYDAKIPERLELCDINVATWAARNLTDMMKVITRQHPGFYLEKSPIIPGLGWISSGNGDFSLGNILIEVKHTDRNFVSGDFRQVLMYWLLRYAASVENDDDIWSDCLLLNPRRNLALYVKFDYLLQSASANLSRVELYELLRSVVEQDFERQ